jgi:hypothetical protein
LTTQAPVKNINHLTTQTPVKNINHSIFTVFLVVLLFSAI